MVRKDKPRIKKWIKNESEHFKIRKVKASIHKPKYADLKKWLQGAEGD